MGQHSRRKKGELEKRLQDVLADAGRKDSALGEGDSEGKCADIPTLAGVDLSVPAGSLVMIIGKVGSGKTTLLASMINEIPIEEGHVRLNGTAAYCSQLPWIQVCCCLLGLPP